MELRKRILIEVAIDLDPVPGAFHTEESARQVVEALLLQLLPHYKPEVLKQD